MNTKVANVIPRPKKLFGREVEQARLKSLVSRYSENGIGGAVYIEGESGFGKSILLEDVRYHTDSLLCRSVSLEAEGKVGGSPYKIWRVLIERLAMLDAEVNPEDLVKWLTARIQPDHDLFRHMSLLSEVLPLEIEPNLETEMLREEGLQHILRGLLACILEAECRESRLVIMIDDVHLLDTASWSLLSQLISTMPGIMFMMAARSGSSNAEIGSTRLNSEFSLLLHLNLDPLSKPQLKRLLLNQLVLDEIPESIVDSVWALSAGNPYFCDELAIFLNNFSDLKERIRENEGVAQVLASLDTLYSLEGLIAVRVDNLTDVQLQVLKCSSVLGYVFDADVLVVLKEYVGEDVDISDVLGELVEANLLQISHGVRDNYRFSHDVIYTVVYALIRAEKKKLLHSLAARWYETKKGYVLNAYIGKLVYHWEAAGNEARTLYYLEKSANQAIRHGGYREAIHLFQRLITYAEKSHGVVSDDDLADWHERIVEARQSIGETWRSQEGINQTLGILGLSKTTGVFSWYVLVQVTIKQFIYRLFPRLTAQEKSGHARRMLIGSRIYERLAEVHFYQNAPLRCFLACILQLNATETLGDSPERVRALSIVHLVLAGLGLKRLSAYYLKLAIQCSKNVTYIAGGTTAEGFRKFSEGMALTARNELNSAKHTLEESLETFTQQGELRSCTDALAILEFIAGMRGDFSEVDRLLDWHLGIALRMEAAGRINSWHYVWVCLARAQNCIQTGRLEQASTILEEVDKTSPDNKDNFVFQSWYTSNQALLSISMGEYSAAHEWLRTLTARLEQNLTFSLNLLEAYATPAFLLLQEWSRLGTHDEDRVLLAGLRLLKRFSAMYPMARPRYLMLRGWYLNLSGHSKRGVALVEKSLQMAGDKGYQFDKSLALLILAECHRKDADQRKKYASLAEYEFLKIDSAVLAKYAGKLVQTK